jgi:hypothetical protein
MCRGIIFVKDSDADEATVEAANKTDPAFPRGLCLVKRYKPKTAKINAETPAPTSPTVNKILVRPARLRVA